MGDSTRGTLFDVCDILDTMEDDLSLENIHKEMNFKETENKVYDWNRMISEIVTHNVVLAFKDDACVIIKNNFGSTGELGSQAILDTFIKLFYHSIDCNIKIFQDCFEIELQTAIQEVLDRHKVSLRVIEE